MSGPLEQLTTRLRRRDLGVVVLIAMLLLSPLAVLAFRMSLPTWFIAVWMVPVLACCGAWLENRRATVDPISMAAHLDRRLDSVEDSAGLLAMDRDQLPVLQRLQRDRVTARLANLPPGLLPWPRRMLISSGVFAAALGTVAFTVPLALMTSDPLMGPEAPLQAGDLESVRIRIVPPAYTGLDARIGQHLDVDAEEGSDLSFRLQFQTAVADVRLLLDDGSELHAIDPGGRVHQIRAVANQDRVYRLHWRDAAGPRSTDFHRLRLIRDRPPTLTVIQPERSPHSVESEREAEALFVLQASDDHGFSDARILATVAKGMGEGVKFREVELSFDTMVETEPEAGKARQLSRRFVLPDLEMSPGDELYFQAEVSDNREPNPNQSKTGMLMLRWEAEEEAGGLAIGGIAVDLLPEYFRSQRQIIIDTERLIEDAPDLKRQAGQRRSRGLAFDQKALRIRYGQYLGEEYSSEVGDSVAPETSSDDEHDEESYAEHLKHTGTQEHNEDEHGPASATIDSLPEFMASFVHSHDSSEQATLFDEKTRETLKAALAAMWDAELSLHLSQPLDALPHEYRALKLLKEVQQANRIYVRRVGFAPPALDEGKRLSGELEDASGLRTIRPRVTATVDPGQRSLRTLLVSDPGSREFRASLVDWRNRLASEPEAIDTRLDLIRLLEPPGDDHGRCQACLERVRAEALRRLAAPLASPRRLGRNGSRIRSDGYLNARSEIDP